MYVCMFYYIILFGYKALLWDISTYILFYQSYNTSSACIYVCIHVCIYVCICTYCMYGSRTFVLESYKTFMDLYSNNMRSIISWYSLKEIYLSVYFSLLFLHFPIRVLEGT